MWLRLAACAVFAIAPCLVASAQSPGTSAGTLTLDDAFARVAHSHPDLRLVDSQRGLLSAEFDRASLRPAEVTGISIENALGSGTARGFDEAEISLTPVSYTHLDVYKRQGVRQDNLCRHPGVRWDDAT